MGTAIDGGGDNKGITNGSTDPNSAHNTEDRQSAIAHQGLHGPGGFSNKAPSSDTALSDSLGGTVEAGTTATIGNATVTAITGGITVNAVENLHVDSTQGGVGVGIAGAGAGIGVFNIAENVKATAGGTLSAGGAINVHANLFEDIDELAFAGGGGFIGLGAAVAVINDSSTTTAGIDSGATIHKASAIDVLAHANQKVKGLTVGVAVGLVAVGASFTKVDVENSAATDVYAYVGNNVNIAQDFGDSVGGLSVQATSSIAGKATAFGLSVGLVSGTVNFAFVDANPDVTASIGTGSHINIGGNINVSALAQPEGDAKTIGVSVGLGALGASISHANLHPNAQASLPGRRRPCGQQHHDKRRSQPGSGQHAGLPHRLHKYGQ